MKRYSLLYVKHLICAILLFLLMLPTPVSAAEGIVLSTTYPGITANPGETVTFSVRVSNEGSQDRIVQLRLDEFPEGWKVSLEGQGRPIHQVYVKRDSYENVNLKAEIPETVESGDYTITLSGLRGNNLLDSLKMNVKISLEPAGEDKLKAEYSELTGPADATYNFRLELTNNGSSEQVYSLGADVPAGWKVAFKPSGESQEVASIPVKEGETKGINVSITPAVNVEAGEYTIPVYAASSAGRVVEELKIIISGTYRMEFTTPSGRLSTDVVAGKSKKISMQLENEGSAPLSNVKLSASSTPDNWTVEFEPETVDYLEPGGIAEVTATITADGKAIAGDYVLTMRASAKETTDSTTFRVTVKTSTLWGVVGIALVVLVGAGLYWVFRTYGRR